MTVTGQIRRKNPGGRVRMAYQIGFVGLDGVDIEDAVVVGAEVNPAVSRPKRRFFLGLGRGKLVDCFFVHIDDEKLRLAVYQAGRDQLYRIAWIKRQADKGLSHFALDHGHGVMAETIGFYKGEYSLAIPHPGEIRVIGGNRQVIDPRVSGEPRFFFAFEVHDKNIIKIGTVGVGPVGFYIVNFLAVGRKVPRLHCIRNSGVIFQSARWGDKKVGTAIIVFVVCQPADKPAVARGFRHEVVRSPVPKGFGNRRGGRRLALVNLPRTVDPLVIHLRDRLSRALLEVRIIILREKRGAPPIVKKRFYAVTSQFVFEKRDE